MTNKELADNIKILKKSIATVSSSINKFLPILFKNISSISGESVAEIKSKYSKEGVAYLESISISTKKSDSKPEKQSVKNSKTSDKPTSKKTKKSKDIYEGLDDVDITEEDIDDRSIESIIKLEKEIEPDLDEELTDEEKAQLLKEENSQDLEQDGHLVSQDPVRDYLRRIAEVDLLTPDDEIELAKKSDIGFYAQWKLENSKITNDKTIKELEWLVKKGKQARTLLIESNLRLVVSLARKFAGRGLDFSTLISVGNDGLTHAAKGYDYTTQFRFSTYAVWWIRQAITRGLMNLANWNRIPVHMHETISKVRNAERDLEVTLRHKPNDEEIAEYLDLPLLKIQQIKQVMHKMVPVPQTTIDNDGNSTSMESIIHDEGPDKIERITLEEIKKALKVGLSMLTEREQEVMHLRYGLDDEQHRPLRDVGRLMNITCERVRQLENKAISKLRHPSIARYLLDYVEE